MNRRRTATRWALGFAALITFTGCGSDTGNTPAGDPAARPTATDAAGPEPSTVISDSSTTSEPGGDAPLRVVSLSPTHTEIMFAIGAGDLLVAVDEFSNYPAQTLELPHDLSAYEPNVEAIAAFTPDLVLLGGDFNGLGEQLAAVGIDSWDGPAAAALDDVYTQIEQLGAATGHIGEAAELVGQMQSEIATITASMAAPAEPLTYYHELDPTLFSVDSTTFVGALYSMLGLANIADPVGADAGGYPQLNAEFVVAADPDLIFLADTKCCGQSAVTVAARDGWATITAVVEGRVVELDDDVASRWGPRVVELLRTIADAVTSETVTG